ncbi:MAG: phosphoribosylanthranilate isomerase, partial [Rhodospirillaceae bacterium]
MSTAVKICGITRIEDAQAAARSGAHAIGLVFHAPSPRNVTFAQARAIAQALPPFVTPVGLFVDAPAERVRETIAEVPIQLLQFHGDESPEYCAAFRLPYIKAARVTEDLDLVEYARTYSEAKGLLLDAYVAGVHGGTGTAF